VFIGEILVALGLVTEQDVAAALKLNGGKRGGIGRHLVEAGKLTPEDLDKVIAGAPVAPAHQADSGVSSNSLLNLLTKLVYVADVETPSEIAELLKLPLQIVLEVVEDAEDRTLLTSMGSAVRADIGSERRYALTKVGVEWAHAAMRRSEYVGPAPVPLAAYREQIGRQRLANTRIDQRAIEEALADMVTADELRLKLGPAINSSRSMLLYGPPGNGKTSIAERIGKLFSGIVYVPYCFEVDGQIVKVFDPGVHEPIPHLFAMAGTDPLAVHRERFDPRWVACRRPFISVGGELTIEMLDLGFNAEAKFYEAPMHIKALGGVCLIDDFGRQLVTPKALLNRWIVPLEGGHDRLKLHSGKSFVLPFDELVIFATNLAPKDLMDAAFLRRIPYKVEAPAPSVDTYREIFRRAAEAAGVKLEKRIVDEVIAEISERNGFPLANYQPRFIIDQIRAAGRFLDAPPNFDKKYVEMALSNLHTKDTPGYGEGPKAVRGKQAA
jgi:predicted ATPase with chaperone activity